MPVVICGLVAAVILMVLFRNLRREAVASQHNKLIEQKRADEVRRVREGTVDDLILLTKAELTAYMNSEDLPLETDVLKGLISDKKSEIREEIVFYEEKKIPDQEDKLKEDHEEIQKFISELLECDVKVSKRKFKHDFNRVTRKQIRNNKRALEKMDELMARFTNPLAFFCQNVDCEDFVGDTEELVSVRELFEDVIRNRIKDQNLTARADSLLKKIDADREVMAKFIAAKSNLESEANKLEDFLEREKLFADAFFNGWELKSNSME